MKKLFLLTLCMIAASLYGQSLKREMALGSKGTVITVNTPNANCLVALISDEEAGSGQYGWWSVWHEMKEQGTAKTSPAVFQNVPAGDYTLVVYLDNAEYEGDGSSDGIALENIHVGSYLTQVTYTFQKYRDFKDWNCLSCPWLCVYDGEGYVKQEEVIKDVVGYENRTTTVAEIAPEAIIEGQVRIQIREEKDEVSYLDRVVLQLGDQVLLPIASDERLHEADDSFLDLHKGQSVELAFDIPEGYEGPLEVKVTGYYHPSPEFIAEITARLLHD